MQFRRRTGTVVVVLMFLIYAGTLGALEPLVSTDSGPAEAQGYPAPSATDGAYPGPVIPTMTVGEGTSSATPAAPTATRRPTNTPVRRNPTSTSAHTPTIMLTPVSPLRRATASPIVTGTTGRVTPPATPTSGVVLVLPATVTQRAPATRVPLGQQAVPAATGQVTVTIADAAQPAHTPTSASGLPSTDLLPPVFDRQTEPGRVLTLLAGVALAVLAWWVWTHWLSAGADTAPDNPEDYH